MLGGASHRPLNPCPFFVFHFAVARADLLGGPLAARSCSDSTHPHPHPDKGEPVERRGRKDTGLTLVRGTGSRARCSEGIDDAQEARPNDRDDPRPDERCSDAHRTRSPAAVDGVRALPPRWSHPVTSVATTASSAVPTTAATNDSEGAVATAKTRHATARNRVACLSRCTSAGPRRRGMPPWSLRSRRPVTRTAAERAKLRSAS